MIDWDALYEAARAAREKAYAPYSKFKVGAALLLADGRILPGCNVENRTFGLTICGERTAIATAVAQGCREFQAIAVVTDNVGLGQYVLPIPNRPTPGTSATRGIGSSSFFAVICLPL